MPSAKYDRIDLLRCRRHRTHDQLRHESGHDDPHYGHGSDCRHGGNAPRAAIHGCSSPGKPLLESSDRRGVHRKLHELADYRTFARRRRFSRAVRLRRTCEPLSFPVLSRSRRRPRQEGLDRIFKEAGAEWRESGCSMCIAMNGDKLEPGQISVSTSNRNFEGRQGPGGRTLLASPLTAAASAVTGPRDGSPPIG